MGNVFVLIGFDRNGEADSTGLRVFVNRENAEEFGNAMVELNRQDPWTEGNISFEIVEVEVE